MNKLIMVLMMFALLESRVTLQFLLSSAGIQAGLHLLSPGERLVWYGLPHTDGMNVSLNYEVN
jgi:hypothetical protein